MLSCVCARMLSCVSVFVTPWIICSSLGSSIHGIFQASMQDQVAIVCCRGSSWPRDRTRVSWVPCIGRWILYHCATWEAHVHVLFTYVVLGSSLPLTWLLGELGQCHLTSLSLSCLISWWGDSDDEIVLACLDQYSARVKCFGDYSRVHVFFLTLNGLPLTLV